MIRGLLESEGIESFEYLGLRGSQVAAGDPEKTVEFGAGRVMVVAADAERARALLERRAEEAE